MIKKIIKHDVKLSTMVITPEASAGGLGLPAKKVGKLDMVIAFDTTGSMAAYIGQVRHDVAKLIPSLFEDNKDLRLGLVAFGDYCDMVSAQRFGNAYQRLQPTDNENDLVHFIRNARDTGGGDGDEFYELVLKKIVEETPWRDGSTRSILLIADANPHPLGYTYSDFVVNNKISWRRVAKKAAAMGIQIDTVSIHDLAWLKELSAMTNGVNVPFKSAGKTSAFVESAVLCRGSEEARSKFDRLRAERCHDAEMAEINCAYECKRNMR